jgi:hypothetical protein
MAMATSYGDSRDGIPRPSYGVLGSGVAWSFTDQDGNTQVVNATGVFGVTGGRSDISDAMDDIDNNFVMPMNAAVAGVLPQSTPTTLTYLAIGFLPARIRSPPICLWELMDKAIIQGLRVSPIMRTVSASTEEA